MIRYNPHAAVGLPDAFGNKNIMLHGAADAWPWRGVALAAHIARFFSLSLGAITVLSAYRITRAISPGLHGHRNAGVGARGLQPAVPVYQRGRQQR